MSYRKIIGTGLVLVLALVGTVVEHYHLISLSEEAFRGLAYVFGLMIFPLLVDYFAVCAMVPRTWQRRARIWFFIIGLVLALPVIVAVYLEDSGIRYNILDTTSAIAVWNILGSPIVIFIIWLIGRLVRSHTFQH